MKKIVWIIFTVILIFVLVWILDIWKSGSNKITDYGRVCNQNNTSIENCKFWNLFATTYILDKSNETVMWYDGSGDAQRSNCHIGDVDNWWCDAYEGIISLEGNGQNVIGFAGGKSIENTPAYPATSTEHFGAMKYWWFKI